MLLTLTLINFVPQLKELEYQVEIYMKQVILEEEAVKRNKILKGLSIMVDLVINLELNSNLLLPIQQDEGQLRMWIRMKEFLTWKPLTRKTTQSPSETEKTYSHKQFGRMSNCLNNLKVQFQTKNISQLQKIVPNKLYQVQLALMKIFPHKD